MQFKLKLMADINTAYLEKSDLSLLQSAIVDGHLATEDDGNGDFFYMPVDVTAGIEERNEAFEEAAQVWFGDFGLSERFVEIMRELCSQGIQYVRFHGDGENVDGLAPALIDEENDG